MVTRYRIDEKEIRQEFKDIKDANQFLRITGKFLIRNADEKFCQKICELIPNCGKCYGIPVQALRAIVRQVGRIIYENPESGLTILRKLWENGSREERKIAGEAVAYFFVSDSDTACRIIMEWLPDINNWEICDTLASFSLKPYVIDNPDMVIRMGQSWIKSPNPWLRRFALGALITMAQQNKADDPDIYLTLLKQVMADDDEIVQKSAAKLAREITLKDPVRVEKFLDIFTSHREVSTRRIIREGSKKLAPEVREALLRKIGE